MIANALVEIFFDLLDAGMDFCFKHLNLHGRVVGLQRDEKLEIPIEALREALINALCHRSYDSISGSVSLAIYDDRLEIENPGRFPVGITPDKIVSLHDSRPFNPLIAETLYKCTWLESWGSGVGRMRDACLKQQLVAPFYELRPSGIAIVFKRNLSTHGEIVGENSGENLLTERQQHIYNSMKENGENTAKDLARILGLSQRTVEREISFLRHNGYIDKDGTNKGVWIILK